MLRAFSIQTIRAGDGCCTVAAYQCFPTAALPNWLLESYNNPTEVKEADRGVRPANTCQRDRDLLRRFIVPGGRGGKSTRSPTVERPQAFSYALKSGIMSRTAVVLAYQAAAMQLNSLPTRNHEVTTLHMPRIKKRRKRAVQLQCPFQIRMCDKESIRRVRVSRSGLVLWCTRDLKIHGLFNIHLLVLT